MNENEKKQFKENSLKVIDEALEHIWNLRHFQHQIDFSGEPPTFDQNEIIAYDGFKNSIESLKLRIQYYLESNNLSGLLFQFNNEFDKYKEKTTKLEFMPDFDFYFSPCLNLLSMYLNAITSDIELPGGYERELAIKRKQLEQILQGTGKLISDRKIAPEKEKDVRFEVYNTLIHIFPDTVREIPISKITKTYKPDIGIKSLKSAIEYKFAASKEEAKKCIGGIFEDIKGYEGSEDWKFFYAVIYMTDNFFTPAQIEYEFKLSGENKNWRPILVWGKGERKKKVKNK